MELLKGYGLIEKNNISWFPNYILPKEPELRFELLFKKLPIWSHSQLLPYLEGTTQADSKDQLLMKWTLCVIRDGIKYYSQKK